MSKQQKPLTEEEKEARALRAKRRFKAVVRLVIANNAWLADAENQEEQGVSDNVAKNVHMLTRKKRGVTGNPLNLQDKSILRKPSIARTEEEKHLLSLKLGDLEAFRRFPQEVKDELPSVMFFVYYEAGREVIREGCDPINMYVILSGEVLVSRTYWDYVLNAETTKTLGSLGFGSIFGESALLYDTTRTATITTLSPCELLFMNDDDFEQVLKEPMERVCNEIRKDLSSIRYFDHMEEIDIREGCMLGRKRTFPENEIILANRPDQWRSNVHFITKGSVYMLEYILIGMETKNGKKVYQHLDGKHASVDPAKVATSNDIQMFMKEVEDAENKSRVKTGKATEEMSIKWHFIKICTYRKLGCFNVGESLQNRLIVANSDVECLILPRDFLDDKCDVTFTNVELAMIKGLPTPPKVFDAYLENKAWIRYKENVINNILKRANRLPVNTIHNVPYSIRLTDDLNFCCNH